MLVPNLTELVDNLPTDSYIIYEQTSPTYFAIYYH